VHAIHCRLSSVHLRESEIERYVAGQLSASRGSALAAHVAECATCLERLEKAGHTIHTRRGLVGLVRVLQPFSPMRMQARVVAKTDAVIRLQVPEPVEPGSLLQVQLKDAIVMAEARYCVQAMAQFLVGVLIRNVFPRPESNPS